MNKISKVYILQLIVVVALLFFPSFAQAKGVNTMNLITKNDTFSVVITPELRMNFEKTNLILTTKSGVMVFEVDSVMEWKHTKEDIPMSDTDAKFEVSIFKNRVYINNVQKTLNIVIYDILGHIFYNNTINTDTSVSLDHLAKGVYIMRVDKQLYKVWKN